MGRTPNSSQKKPSSRVARTSQRQRDSNENAAAAAAKTANNKKKAQQTAARREQRASNNAQAAALRDATNTTGGQNVSLSSADQIAALTAELRTANAKVEVLGRKNKKLAKTVRRARQTPTIDADIISIPKPKGKFNIQSTMGLNNNRALFTRLQSGIHELAFEAKIDFSLSWSHQDPAAVAKVLRVAEERHEYLTSKRFPRSWATSTILQHYLNGRRAYASGKANPASGVNRRRQRLTNVGRLEAEVTRATGRRNNRVVTSPPDEENQMDVDADAGGSQTEDIGTRDDSPSSEESEKDELEGPDRSDGSNSDDDEEGGAEDSAENLPVALD